MSFALDVNILLYASDMSSPHHDGANRFLDDCVSREEVFYLGWPTVMSYLCIATHPSIFDRPLTPAEAMINIESLATLPQVRFLAEDDRFWELYRKTTTEVPTRGNLVPDAHLAALLRQHGVRTICTHDSDFRKFRFLEVLDPLEEP